MFRFRRLQDTAQEMKMGQFLELMVMPQENEADKMYVYRKV